MIVEYCYYRDADITADGYPISSAVPYKYDGAMESEYGRTKMYRPANPQAGTIRIDCVGMVDGNFVGIDDYLKERGATAGLLYGLPAWAESSDELPPAIKHNQ